MSVEKDPIQHFDLAQTLREMPEQPGVYQFLDRDGELIYVGKAKNLKKRINSYFQKEHNDRKTNRMVSKIRAIRYILVNSEFDAILLENNLIKENQPKYNVELKDDKSYPFVCVTREHFPKIYPTRRPQFGRHDYYGPYASVGLMNNILELIRELYPIRTCNLDLSPEKIAKGNYKVCLEYHIFNCKGPCENLESEAAYEEYIKGAKDILKGNLKPAKEYFQDQMNYHAERMEFEKAQMAKEKLDKLQHYQSKSLIVNPKLDHILIVGFSETEKQVFCNSLMIHNGYITATENHYFKKKTGQTPAEVLNQLLAEKLKQESQQVKTVITNIQPDEEYEEIDFVFPKIGDKKKLLNLSIKNAITYKQDILLQKRKSTKEDSRLRPLVALEQDLHLKELPKHIECFDNSNLQGSNPVAAMVCFLNGQPAKSEYRKYTIKTVKGPDDYASMREVVGRRYRRLKEEYKPLPQLVVIDGGKGQLSAAVDALKEVGVYGELSVVGIAKRLEEIYFPEDPIPLHIDKKSESLRLLQRLRNEAHRFAITFHRKRRGKQSLKDSLQEIPGIGPKTVKALRSHFKSLNKAKEASEEELTEVIGKQKARSIIQHVLKTKKPE